MRASGRARVGWGVMNDAPIGIFDSGVGGLTVARAIRAQLPRESFVYIGDTAHSPYGPKPIADVRRYSLEVLDTLVDQGVKMLVIACNTASAAMLRDARERYDIPVVEVIGPAVRRAVSTTRNGRVGVIGTVGTIGSRAYQDMLEVNERLRFFTAACPRFVEFVEAGITGTPEVLAVAEEYLAPLRNADVDTLVLGCTHYPFLRGAISYVMGEGVTLVSATTRPQATCTASWSEATSWRRPTRRRPTSTRPPEPRPMNSRHWPTGSWVVRSATCSSCRPA